MRKRARNLIVFFVFLCLLESRISFLNKESVFSNEAVVLAASNEDKNKNGNEDKGSKKEDKINNNKNIIDDKSNGKKNDSSEPTLNPSPLKLKIPISIPKNEGGFVIPQLVQENLRADLVTVTPTMAATTPAQPPKSGYQRLIQAPVQLIFRDNPRQYYLDNFISSSSTNILIAISLLAIVSGVSILKFSHKLLFSIF